MIHKHGPGMHHHHDFTMMKQLNLSDTQKQQMKDLNANYKNQLKELEQNDNINIKYYI